MEILNFHVDDDSNVTLEMEGMPQGPYNEKVVEIADEPQGNPLVTFSIQKIEFKAKQNAKAGKITVKITTVGSVEYTSTSAEDYIPPAPEPVETKPRVNSIVPPTAKRNGRVSLLGANLGEIGAVGLKNAKGYYLCRVITAQDKTVVFTVDPKTLTTSLAYPVYIRKKAGGAMMLTNVKLTVTD